VPRLVVSGTLAVTFAGAGWALGRDAFPAGVSGSVTPAHAASPRSCYRTCTAAYRAIAEVLPHDHDNRLARAIVHTPGFDYAKLSRLLRIPTVSHVRAQWRRNCLKRFPTYSQEAAACIRMIDSWTPLSLPTPPDWAES